MAGIWNPEWNICEAQAIVEKASGMVHRSRPPFCEQSLAMLGDISRRILRDPLSRNIPQYVALAYWLRPASLKRLSGTIFNNEIESELRTARGLALHLPPTNVDTIFVYSWALSVLAGNANITRLAENLSQDAQWLVKLIANSVFDHGENDRQLFCTYSYGAETERALSAQCDLRLIWGGDDKVNTVSRTNIRPDGLSIGFPDRKSLAIISAGVYKQADDIERDKIVVQFFNDMFWFDQMGCGSPRLLIWHEGEQKICDDFYARLCQIIVDKGFLAETGIAIEKLALGNSLLAQGISQQQFGYNNELTVNRVTDAKKALQQSQGGGFLCDWFITDLHQISSIITRNVQTITYYGLSQADLKALAINISGKGGYRIVPIGQALQFDPTWDGVSLFDHMTRKITIRV